MKIVGKLLGYPIYAEDTFPDGYVLIESAKAAIIVKIPDGVIDTAAVGADDETITPKKRGRKAGAKPEKKKRGWTCRKCGEEGHNAKTCKFVTDTPPAAKPDTIQISPAKLAQAKKLLGEGEPMSFVASEVGISEETVEKIATQLGI